ncbi:hypothetical protein [Streptomyces sp. NBC_00271]|uniref:hypothetical protein n=1 Tax=Streptomyces sp. NBC_00271 TaxID=2975697 RepID=UPI002E2D153C|nr:hypothetical protein [Streptomyces sp. NBC_00271]
MGPPVLDAVAHGDRVYLHMCHSSEPRAATGGFGVVREEPAGVVLAIGATLAPVPRATGGATAGQDLADVVLVEPYPRGTSAQHVAEALVPVRSRPS